MNKNYEPMLTGEGGDNMSYRSLWVIFVVIFMVCAVSFAEEGVQQVNVETREVAGEPDTTPPAPPTGIRVQQPYIEAGEIEQRYEDYAPTGDIRMKDGQGEWVEYSNDGAESGDGWQK